MPELPEVEIVKCGLEEIFKNNSTIKKIECYRSDLRHPMPVKELAKLNNLKVVKVERRAKFLLIRCEQVTLVSHLGMTGTWRLANKADQRKHDHLCFLLSGGQRLVYHDPRRFGEFLIFNDELQKRLSQMGPEPLNPDTDWDHLYSQIKEKQCTIKIAIMDQKFLVGVGNIYASEALYRAGLRPTRVCAKVKKEEWQRLAIAIQQVLQEAILAGGSTINDFAQTSGGQGYFQNQFQVYERENQSCFRCHSKIKKIVLGGRSTYYCSKCQR